MKKVSILRIDILFSFCLGTSLADSSGDKEESSSSGAIDKPSSDAINKNIQNAACCWMAGPPPGKKTTIFHRGRKMFNREHRAHYVLRFKKFD